MKLLIHLGILFICSTIHSQVLNILIEEGKYQIDESVSLILSHINDIEDYSDLQDYDQVNIVFGLETYSFTSIPEQLSYSDSYELSNGLNTYQLYFTQLPIITVSSDYEIVDEPKVLANFTYTDDSLSISTYMGIELRGGVSQLYPKKTYDVEFWEDVNGNEKAHYGMGSLRTDDDWILDGLYNEHIRIRSYISQKLWLQMHTPAYIDDEPEAKSGADIMYVEMFLNNNYNGVYLLSEQVDRKLLQLKNFDGSIRGELYKGEYASATTFSELPEYDNNLRTWGGYEMKYPKEEDITNWENLYNFTDFVMNSTNNEYQNDIWNKFNKDNNEDYFIFLNLIRATDNTGKNIYLGKYTDKSVYFYVPWDLDGSWGMVWDGSTDQTTEDILVNGLYERNLDISPDGFRFDLGSKWIDYRNDILSNDALYDLIDTTYYYLVDNNVYSRESIVHGNYSFEDHLRIYIHDWLDYRLDFLDLYFNDLLNIEDTVNKSNLIIYPNPASSFVYVHNAQFESYQIIDMTGMIIGKGMIHNNKGIDISEIGSGLYFLKVGHRTLKFLVE